MSNETISTEYSAERKEGEQYNAHHVVEWTHYLTHPEVDALQELARMLPPNPIIVNIGSGNGTSTLAMMQSRDDCTIYSVDIQLEASPYGCLEGERIVLEKAGFVGDPRYQQIHGDSKEVGRDWKKNYDFLVDMVFIDGGHLFHEAKGDIEIWEPLIKPHGIIAIHDFEKQVKVWTGVNRAVREHFGNRLPVTRVDSLIAYEVGE